MKKKTKSYDKALAEMSNDTPNLEYVFSLLSHAKSKGDNRALYALGTWYFYGKYVKKDKRKAIKFYKKAAKSNNPDAQFDLALCYENGEGIKKDTKRAFELYLDAALNGDDQSFFEVGRCYFYGIGVKKNKRISAVWFKHAKALGIE